MIFQADQVNWKKHLNYLNGYGPWISLSKSNPFYKGLFEISQTFKESRPQKTTRYWLFNAIKHYKSRIFSTPKTSVKPPENVFYYSSGEEQCCNRCILTSKDVEAIYFDQYGICNYCRYYDTVTQKLGSWNKRQDFIRHKVEEIKKNGQGHDYDCILGVSGGTDSSYLAYWAHQQGLRPLVVHFDNGWNSELAVENIQRICDKLGFSLQTYVINWEEFKQLQLAYLRAGVIDIEALTDHAIYATIYKIASKYKIRYTLSGFNYATEAIMPKGWVFDKTDFTNIRDINEKYGKAKIKSFPHITFLKKFWFSIFLKIESIQVLNYIDYHKEQAKDVLKKELGWRDYGGKHYESIFTKFYQAYILPTKFHVDKRKAHLSTLICSGQITKSEAKLELQKPLYDPQDLVQEKEYVLKKLGLSETEFDKIMASPPRKHTDFKTQQRLWERYFRLIQILRPWKK
ncbi:MAG: N-acetyl sugar amidotransferase [Bacteroidetes bacterium]|nr:N-acetyl sugar amidotransferase [Bacteroidota bacterium]